MNNPPAITWVPEDGIWRRWRWWSHLIGYSNLSSGDAAGNPQLPTAGGTGGDGIVIIRYKDPNKKKRCADGLTI